MGAKQQKVGIMGWKNLQKSVINEYKVSKTGTKGQNIYSNMDKNVKEINKGVRKRCKR